MACKMTNILNKEFDTPRDWNRFGDTINKNFRIVFHDNMRITSTKITCLKLSLRAKVSVTRTEECPRSFADTRIGEPMKSRMTKPAEA